MTRQELMEHFYALPLLVSRCLRRKQTAYSFLTNIKGHLAFSSILSVFVPPYLTFIFAVIIIKHSYHSWVSTLQSSLAKPSHSLSSRSGCLRITTSTVDRLMFFVMMASIAITNSNWINIGIWRKPIQTVSFCFASYCLYTFITT